ncbi:MAG TPA: DUF2079 domain-containing protein [Actinocrinis sp.]|nr:DUF2079 domain-containing protein [Actinocrinis sp.]
MAQTSEDKTISEIPPTGESTDSGGISGDGDGDGEATEHGETDETTGNPPRRWSSGAALGPWIVVAALTALYSVLSIAHYETAGAGSWDLGMFTEVIKQYAHFHSPIDDIKSPGYDLLGDHFHPIIALLGPFFLIFPSPITLLVGQAFLFSLAAAPIIWLGRDKISAGAGYGLGIAYGLSFGIAQAADFDFHEIAFATPVIAFALCALVRGQYRQTIWWCVALLFCKEDFGLFFVMPVGILMIARGEIRRGVILAATGTAATLLCVFVILPHFNPDHVYQYWSLVNTNGAQGPQGMALGPMTGHFFADFGTKFQLIFLLVVCTAALAMRSPVALTAVLGLVFRFVSTTPAYWGTMYHYNAPVMPILFVAAADAMIRARNAPPLPDVAGGAWRFGRRMSTAMGQHGAVAALAVSVALIPQFALNQYFNLPQMFNVSPQRHAADYAVSLVPDGATVETNVCELAPLAARADTFWIGWPAPKNPAVQYAVIDTQCFDLSGTPIGDPVTFEQDRHPGTKYQVVYQSSYGVYVVKRV